MDSLASLTSMMTSSLTSFLLLLIIGSPGVVTSDGPSVDGCLRETLSLDQKEWTANSASQIIQVIWNFDKVCATVEQCYGILSPSVDFVKVNQLPPVQIQLDQFVSFRLEATNVSVEYFHVMSESAFENCDTKGSEALVITNDTIFGVGNGRLTRGNNYFIANSVNGVLQWNCNRYGLRVNITVQPPNCRQDQQLSGQFCNGRGRCSARRYEPSYSCRCCPGYIGSHCEMNDGCYNVTCQSGGTCSDRPDGVSPPFICECIPGFKGTFCESLDGEMCATNECSNSGICLITEAPPYFRCICQQGITGKVCETNIDECASSPCRYGACLDLINGYKCSCYDDYSGVNCETYTGLCPSGQCKNGGTCNPDQINGVASCSCHPGYSGRSCETKVDLCLSNPCNNSIDCVDYGINFKCVCIPGYTGVICDSDVDECASNPCQNDGTCHDHVAAFSCECPEGLPQPTCGTSAETGGGGGKGAIDMFGLMIAVSILGSLFGIALIVLLIYCCVVRKPYKALKRSKYVHVVDETYGRSSEDLSGAHPSPDFVADPVATDGTLSSSGSAKSPLVRRAKHTKPSRI